MKPTSLLKGLAAAGCIAVGSVASAEQDVLPEDAFLEFLGGFETADGDWVDPMSLAELDGDTDAEVKRESDDEEMRGDDEDET
ncbi:MAG: hypothetical protein HKN59_04010 [Gammaproteobacteria bacterium]|nr:hypothetical protein [Gammaproteobacteria bacterium]